MLSDLVVPVGPLLESCQQYVELQRAHMRNEHVHLFPLAERLLDDEDWRDIGRELEQRPDPMFERRLERFASLYRHVTE